MNNSPKLTRQGVRDLNGIKPKASKPHLAPAWPHKTSFDFADIRRFAEDTVKVHERAGDGTAATIWRFIISRYNTEIDRLTAELASARKGDRT